MRKYQLRFEFMDTEEQAKAFCDHINATQSYYMRKHNPATYHWSDHYNSFICWYKA